MTTAAILVAGIGYVTISTSDNEVRLAGALTATGDPVNTKMKKIFKSRKATEEAAESRFVAIPVKKKHHDGEVFVLVDTALQA